ncbi:hypothetical protein GCM10028857_04430 [Salinarchaeum chitinilyticum]
MAPTDVTDAAGTPLVANEESYLASGATWLAHRERWLWFGVTLALFADVVTTLLGFQAGLAEGNPVVASAIDGFGVAGFLTIKAGALVLAYGVRVAFPRYRVAIPLGIALPWMAVAITNTALLLAVA